MLPGHAISVRCEICRAAHPAADRVPPRLSSPGPRARLRFQANCLEILLTSEILTRAVLDPRPKVVSSHSVGFGHKLSAVHITVLRMHVTELDPPRRTLPGGRDGARLAVTFGSTGGMHPAEPRMAPTRPLGCGSSPRVGDSNPTRCADKIRSSVATTEREQES